MLTLARQSGLGRPLFQRCQFRSAWFFPKPARVSASRSNPLWPFADIAFVTLEIRNVEHAAVKILNRNRIMAISTIRPDGWPQTTVVGYVNRGFEIFFLIFRSGQKYQNIKQNDRVSIAVAAEPASLPDLRAVYAGGHADEVTDQSERDEIWRLFMQRSSNLAGFKIPEATDAAFMRMMCKYVSVLDFSQGLGHREQLTVDDTGTVVDGRSEGDAWALSTAEEPGG